MKIEYEIKGITLTELDMYDIKKYYEAACTAEYIMENYDISNEEKAMELGYEVRRLMDKYGYEEEKAIEQVLSETDDDDDDDEYCPSSTNGDYSPSNPWDAPGMSIRDFIR